jgi:hypothetical protein
MRQEMQESEEQRRRRVGSRIRNEMLADVAADLIEMARGGKLPDEWMTVDQVNARLDRAGYWAGHRHVMASFLSAGACEDLVERALESLIGSHPDVWARVGEQYKPAGRDWNVYASRKANILRRDYPDAARTALHTGSDGASVLFAHDDYENDPRAREEVSLLRGYLREAAIPEFGFGVSDDGRTWVMVVWSQDEEALRKALFDAWERAFNGVEEINFG